MNREELEELHYIAPIANMPSILKLGILSNKHAKKIPHQSIAKSDIQDLRAKVRVPGGLLLHEYANLYICARNPMLYLRQAQHRSFCVLRISPTVVDMPGVVITDRNAASEWARFASAPDGLSIVNANMTFAEYWTHPEDQIAEWRHKSMKCAEVLVPDAVAPNFILGAYVSCKESGQQLSADCSGLPATENRHLFFR